MKIGLLITYSTSVVQEKDQEVNQYIENYNPQTDKWESTSIELHEIKQGLTNMMEGMRDYKSP